MKGTPSDRFNGRASEWIGDMIVWKRENCEDNSEQLSRLRRQLRRAMEQELTRNQRYYLSLHFMEGLSVSQIARQEGVCCSTVSRTISRAKARLYRYLQYAL